MKITKEIIQLIRHCDRLTLIFDLPEDRVKTLPEKPLCRGWEQFNVTLKFTRENSRAKNPFDRERVIEVESPGAGRLNWYTAHGFEGTEKTEAILTAAINTAWSFLVFRQSERALAVFNSLKIGDEVTFTVTVGNDSENYRNLGITAIEFSVQVTRGTGKGAKKFNFLADYNVIPRDNLKYYVRALGRY